MVDMSTYEPEIPGDAADREPSRSGDDLNTHALAIISLLYNRVVAGAASAVRKRIGLSVTEAKVIFHIGACGSTTANKVAKIVGIDKAAISRATNRIVELGLVASERDPNHAGQNLLTLTGKGLIACEAIAHFTFAREEYLLSSLSDAEQRQFLESLRKILTMVDSTNELVDQGNFWD